jgi:hypothetical protein
MNADLPCPARDVPAGAPWAFRDHRTQAEVYQENFNQHIASAVHESWKVLFDRAQPMSLRKLAARCIRQWDRP